MQMKAEHKIRILVVDDEANAREGLKDLLEGWGFEVAVAEDGKAAFEMVNRFQPAIILSDLVMPRTDGLQLLELLRDEGLLDLTTFIILSAHGNINTAVEAIKKGAYDFLTKPLDVVRLKIILEKISKRSAIDKEMILLRDKVRKLGTFGKLNGSTPKMKAVFKQIQVIAPTTASVLITGESGTGKELVAKAIYQNSKRSEKPYIAINCATTPKTLLEKELFGQGQEPGCFESADGGTVFIDEISDLSLDLQIKFLHLLENNALRRIGAKNEIQVDVRVIAATNRNLEELLEDGSFREDLFSRLNIFSIKIPALRERAEDIPLLANAFVEEFNLKNDRHVKGLSRDVINLFKTYSWPGNVREIKNVIERAVVVCKDEFIDLADLPETLTSKAHKAPTVQFRLGQTMENVEKDFLFHTLSYVDGNKTKAAKMLDISLKTLHNKLSKYKSSI
jgi:DNA-binding NtrC family response regulator